MRENDRAPGPPALGYYPFSEYLKRRFGCKVHKVSLHAGFTCPNRDGKAGVGGCTYCINESFSPQVRETTGGQAGKPPRSVREQMADGIAYMRARYRAKKFFAYFQAFSNTYAPVEKLRALYDEAIAFPDVVGLDIGTRPDCVPAEVLDLVESYTGKLEVWLEYGLQSAHDATLRRVNRGHDFAAFCDAVERTRGRNIRICAHVILGLPGETREQMMQTALALQPLGLDAIKLHHLYVARGTPLEAEYRAGRLRLFSAREYVGVACDFLERIPDTVAVQRLVGDTTSEGVLVAPVWPEPKTEILRLIAQEFQRRGTCQGARVLNLTPSVGISNSQFPISN
jgi:radical SAM protein (TIGR01212 family)